MEPTKGVGLQPTSSDSGAKRRRALKFVLMIGAVSFFADFTYEGSRSITGPFLQTLGATGAIVGIVAGLGELLGYGLRFFPDALASEHKNFGPSPSSGTSSRWPQYLCSLLPGIGSLPRC